MPILPCCQIILYFLIFHLEYQWVTIQVIRRLICQAINEHWSEAAGFVDLDLEEKLFSLQIYLDKKGRQF
jgi:hypothetical protein